MAPPASEDLQLRRLLVRASALPVLLVGALAILFAIELWSLAHEDWAGHVRESVSSFTVVVLVVSLVACLVLAVLARAHVQQIAAHHARALREAGEAERRRAEELERRVEDRTRELVLLNGELEAFGYSVSHDLRAPLRAMQGFARALREGQGERLEADGREILQRIEAAGQRMGRLIDALLELSRAGRAEREAREVDLSALAREVAAELAEQEPGRRVEVAVQEGVRGRGDARLLRVALTNLLENAFKFTREAPAARVEFGATRAGVETVYFVRDNGVGFDMAYASRLFQPFQRLHGSAEYEGTGIGLATLQRIVHRHGGRAWAEGTPGAGAAFFFTLG